MTLAAETRGQLLLSMQSASELRTCGLLRTLQGPKPNACALALSNGDPTPPPAQRLLVCYAVAFVAVPSNWQLALKAATCVTLPPTGTLTTVASSR